MDKSKKQKLIDIVINAIVAIIGVLTGSVL